MLALERPSVPGVALVLPDAVRPHFEASREFLAAAKAENTKRAYLADCEAFGAWCAQCRANPVPSKENPQAANEIAALVASYLARCATDERFKVATIRRRLAAITKAYTALGYPSPRQHPRVLGTLEGIVRALGARPNKVVPVDGEVLRRALGQIDLSRLAGRRDRALLLLGYALASRRSELVGLDVADVSWRDEGIVVLIRRSKTDQTAEGFDKTVARNWDDPLTCPVEALKVWLESARITSGPIFRAVTRYDTVRAGRLSDDVVADIVKKYAKAAGYDPDLVSGHSLRAGHW